MRNKTLGLVAVAMIIAIGSGCFFNTSTTTVKGVVMDYGKPVEGAEVFFGPTGGQVSAVTGKDGKFELTAKHRATAMLYVNVKKAGMVQSEKQEFPGFAAPDEEIKIEMMHTIAPTRR